MLNRSGDARLFIFVLSHPDIEPCTILIAAPSLSSFSYLERTLFMALAKVSSVDCRVKKWPVKGASGACVKAWTSELFFYLHGKQTKRKSGINKQASGLLRIRKNAFTNTYDLTKCWFVWYYLRLPYSVLLPQKIIFAIKLV